MGWQICICASASCGAIALLNLQQCGKNLPKPLITILTTMWLTGETGLFSVSLERTTSSHHFIKLVTKSELPKCIRFKVIFCTTARSSNSIHSCTFRKYYSFSLKHMHLLDTMIACVMVIPLLVCFTLGTYNKTSHIFCFPNGIFP